MHHSFFLDLLHLHLQASGEPEKRVAYEPLPETVLCNHCGQHTRWSHHKNVFGATGGIYHSIYCDNCNRVVVINTNDEQGLPIRPVKIV